MDAVTEIALENIRCFAGKQTVSLPRIAALVGENSTGKSTFLACCAALAELSCHEKIDSYDPFNVAPFDLGDFDAIARHGSKDFSLGGRIGAVGLSFTFVNENSKPSEHAATVRAGNAPELEFERLPGEKIWRLTGPAYDFHHPASEISYAQFSQWLGVAVRRGYFPYEQSVDAFKRRANPSEEQIDQFRKLLNHLAKISENLLSSKPALCAVPPHIDVPSRQSAEAPLVASMDEFNRLKDRLREAGEDLGLFSGINIASTPDGSYALELTIDRHTHSIVDAGFGVHSLLPCLKAVIGNSGATVLMQQPETHLHPTAQARLSQLIAESNGRYIIETHADHIIKRLSICIRKKELDPKEAAIFWFEKNGGNGTAIHPISFDEVGNLVNAPPNYREFFIRERRDFLGFECGDRNVRPLHRGQECDLHHSGPRGLRFGAGSGLPGLVR